MNENFHKKREEKSGRNENVTNKNKQLTEKGFSLINKNEDGDLNEFSKHENHSHLTAAVSVIIHFIVREKFYVETEEKKLDTIIDGEKDFFSNPFPFSLLLSSFLLMRPVMRVKAKVPIILAAQLFFLRIEGNDSYFVSMCLERVFTIETKKQTLQSTQNRIQLHDKLLGKR
jgi:hypothetical protein